MKETEDMTQEVDKEIRGLEDELVRIGEEHYTLDNHLILTVQEHRKLELEQRDLLA